VVVCGAGDLTTGLLTIFGCELPTNCRLGVVGGLLLGEFDDIRRVDCWGLLGIVGDCWGLLGIVRRIFFGKKKSDNFFIHDIVGVLGYSGYKKRETVSI